MRPSLSVFKVVSLIFCLTALTLGLSACGSIVEGSGLDDPDPTGSETADLGTAYSMDFTFEIIVDAVDEDYDLEVAFGDTHEITLYVQSDGTVSLQTQDFPTLIYRVCTEASTRTDCDAYTSGTDGDYDLVFDSCEYSDDELCGDDNDTVIVGTLSDAGVFRMNDVPVRSRIFAITTTSSGRTADVTDTGLFDVDPLTTDLTTGTVTINDGERLTATGSPLNSSGDILIVGGGIIPSSYPVLANSYFVGTIDGSFDQNPLDILD